MDSYTLLMLSHKRRLVRSLQLGCRRRGKQSRHNSQPTREKLQCSNLMSEC